jgi:outer membrane protein assembly factor BamA
MRFYLALIVVLSAATLSNRLVQAQTPITSETVSDQECKSASEHQQEPSGPDISIAEVSFWGSPVISTSEQTEIARSVKLQIHGNVLKDVIDESSEVIRGGWQDRGYFNVEVKVEQTVLTRSPVSQRLVLHVQVDAGRQYRLNKITFRNNNVVINENTLRALFPIKDGDIFSRALRLPRVWKLCVKNTGESAILISHQCLKQSSMTQTI